MGRVYLYHQVFINNWNAYSIFEGDSPHEFKLASGSYLPLPPPALCSETPARGICTKHSSSNSFIRCVRKNVCTNKPFHAQLHSVIYSVALANNKSPNRSPPPNSIRKHGSWNTRTVHEVYGVKLIANMALPHYLEGETLMPADIPHICKDAVP